MRTFVLTIVIVLLPYVSWGSQNSEIKEGNSSFKAHKWDESIDHYFNALQEAKNPDIIHYNLGSAFYKKGKYDQSIEHLKKSITGKNSKISQRASYNLGNALYQKGKTLEKENLDQAIESMKESLGQYSQALQMNAKDHDAAYNQKVVEGELKRLEEKKKEQQDQKNQQNNEKQQSKDQNQQKDPQQNQAQNKNQENQNKANPKSQSEDQSSANNNKEQERKEEKEAKEKKAQESQAQEKDKKDSAQSSKNQEAQAGDDPKEEIKKQQVQLLLREYERDEAPKELLNFMKRHKGDSHVDKDW